MTSVFCPFLFPDYTNSKLKSIILWKSYSRHSLIQVYPLKFNISYSYYFILGRESYMLANTLRKSLQTTSASPWSIDVTDFVSFHLQPQNSILS